MGDKTGIEWTDATWNPIRGCSRVSEGCRNCYAERVAARFSGPGQPYEGLAVMKNGDPRWTGIVRLIEDRLPDPLKWKKSRRIFVNSMSDLFHENVQDSWIRLIVRIMQDASQHIFQILTKRPERMAKWSCFGHDSLKHVWLGVSVEDQATADERIPLLLETPAAVRWVSAEPLLGPVDFQRFQEHLPPAVHLGWLDDIDWLVCGGESGPGARPMHPDWARSARDQCVAAGVPFFFKQWGEFCPQSQSPPGMLRRSDDEFDRVGKKAAGRLLDGREWKEYPASGAFQATLETNAQNQKGEQTNMTTNQTSFTVIENGSYGVWRDRSSDTKLTLGPLNEFPGGGDAVLVCVSAGIEGAREYKRFRESLQTQAARGSG